MIIDQTCACHQWWGAAARTHPIALGGGAEGIPSGPLHWMSERLGSPSAPWPWWATRHFGAFVTPAGRPCARVNMHAYLHLLLLEFVIWVGLGTAAAGGASRTAFHAYTSR